MLLCPPFPVKRFYPMERADGALTSVAGSNDTNCPKEEAPCGFCFRMKTIKRRDSYTGAIAAILYKSGIIADIYCGTAIIEPAFYQGVTGITI